MIQNKIPKCDHCNRVFKSMNSLYNHRSNFKGKCKNIVENKNTLQQAQLVISKLQPSDIVRLGQNIQIENEYRTKYEKISAKHESLLKLIKKQKVSIARPVMTQPRRLQIAARQEWKCNTCTKILSSVFEIDHMIPWNESYDDSDENLQALCVECHKLKTAEENTKR